MTPDRLRGWLKRRAKGAITVQLAADTLTGYKVLQEWDRDELKADAATEQTDDIATSMIEAAQEYADAEGTPQKFQIRWVGTNDKVIRGTGHHVKPNADPADDDTAPSTAGVGSGVSDAAFQAVLDAVIKTTSLANAASVTNAAAYEATIKMLQAQLANSNKIIAELSTTRAVAEVVTPQSNEQKEESIQRSEALRVLIQKAPEVLDLIVAAAANKLLPPVEDTH